MAASRPFLSLAERRRLLHQARSEFVQPVVDRKINERLSVIIDLSPLLALHTPPRTWPLDINLLPPAESHVTVAALAERVAMLLVRTMLRYGGRLQRIVLVHIPLEDALAALPMHTDVPCDIQSDYDALMRPLATLASFDAINDTVQSADAVDYGEPDDQFVVFDMHGSYITTNRFLLLPLRRRRHVVNLLVRRALTVFAREMNARPLNNQDLHSRFVDGNVVFAMLPHTDNTPARERVDGDNGDNIAAVHMVAASGVVEFLRVCATPISPQREVYVPGSESVDLPASASPGAFDGRDMVTVQPRVLLLHPSVGLQLLSLFVFARDMQRDSPGMPLGYDEELLPEQALRISSWSMGERRHRQLTTSDLVDTAVFNLLARHHEWRTLPVPRNEETHSHMPFSAGTQRRIEALFARYDTQFPVDGLRDAHALEGALWETRAGAALAHASLSEGLVKLQLFLQSGRTTFVRFIGREALFPDTLADERGVYSGVAADQLQRTRARPSRYLNVSSPLGVLPTPLTLDEWHEVHDNVARIMRKMHPALFDSDVATTLRDMSPTVNMALACLVLLLGDYVRLLKPREWRRGMVPSAIRVPTKCPALPATPLVHVAKAVMRVVPAWIAKPALADTRDLLLPTHSSSTSDAIPRHLCKRLVKHDAQVPIQRRFFRMVDEALLHAMLAFTRAGAALREEMRDDEQPDRRS